MWEDKEAEKKRINGFTLTKTCGCHFGTKLTACSTLFGRELIATMHMNCRETTKAQIDLAI